MAWPFMDTQAKEELVVDKFLMGMRATSSVCRLLHTATAVWKMCCMWPDLSKLHMRRSDMLLVHANNHTNSVCD